MHVIYSLHCCCRPLGDRLNQLLLTARLSLGWASLPSPLPVEEGAVVSWCVCVSCFLKQDMQSHCPSYSQSLCQQFGGLEKETLWALLLWNGLMSAAADDRPLEWSGIEEWWKLHLTICWRVHGAYPSTCTQPQHILIQFFFFFLNLSVRVWHMHTLSHHSANDILSHTCSYDCTAGSVGFSMWPTRGDCTVTLWLLQIPNVHILQSKLDLGLSNK